MQHVYGEVKTFTTNLTFADLMNTAVGAQGAVTIHEILPAGWRIHDVKVQTTTAFNGSGARSLDVGVTGAGDAIIDGLDVKAAAVKAPTVVPYLSDAPIAIIANLITATDNPTAGELYITLLASHVKQEA